MKYGDMELQDAAVVLPSSFKGLIARDASIASGTQAITGVGFTPSSVIFMGTIDGDGDTASWGFDANNGGIPDGGGIRYNHPETADTLQRNGINSIPIVTAPGSGLRGTVQSYDSDGFTIIWIKDGTPTGNFGIVFLAFK